MKKPWSQCFSVHAGRGSASFCYLQEGHKGDHRGKGKQWDRKGRRVKITIPAKE